jgi:hypothetical protein
MSGGLDFCFSAPHNERIGGGASPIGVPIRRALGSHAFRLVLQVSRAVMPPWDLPSLLSRRGASQPTPRRSQESRMQL